MRTGAAMTSYRVDARLIVLHPYLRGDYEEPELDIAELHRRHQTRIQAFGNRVIMELSPYWPDAAGYGTA